MHFRLQTILLIALFVVSAQGNVRWCHWHSDGKHNDVIANYNDPAFGHLVGVYRTEAANKPRGFGCGPYMNYETYPHPCNLNGGPTCTSCGNSAISGVSCTISEHSTTVDGKTHTDTYGSMQQFGDGPQAVWPRNRQFCSSNGLPLLDNFRSLFESFGMSPEDFF